MGNVSKYTLIEKRCINLDILPYNTTGEGGKNVNHKKIPRYTSLSYHVPPPKITPNLNTKLAIIKSKLSDTK